MKVRRATDAMVEAFAACEQELGPLAVSLAELQDKVNRTDESLTHL